MNLCEKQFDLDKMQLFLCSKNVQICRHFGPPFAPVFPWFGMNCDVDSGTCNFKLDSSPLFYFCTFKDVRAQRFPRTDFFKTFTAGIKL